MDYFIYARRSSEDKNKQVQSIENQLAWASEIVQEKGFKVVDTFTEKKSASKPGRKEFNRMMMAVNKRKTPVGIITRELSRLARNPIDEGAIKYAFMQEKIDRIITINREYNQGENQILFGVEFGSATQSSIDLSVKVTEGMARRVSVGWRPTMAPLGYMNDQNGLKGLKQIFKDERTWDKCRKIWELAINGNHSGPKLLELAQNMGLKNRNGGAIALSSIYKMFNNPFYAGMISWNGVISEGKHPPLVTMSEFNKVQKIFSLGNQKRERVHENAYAGLIQCAECGGMVTAEPPKNKINKTDGRVRTYHYLRCSKRKKDTHCTQKCIRREALEKQIEEELSKIEIPEIIQGWVFEQIKLKHKEATRDFSKERALIQRSYNENEAKMDTLMDKMLAGVVDDDSYKAKKSAFEMERAKLKQLMDDYDNKKDKWLEKTEAVFKFAIEAPKAFRKAMPQGKRDILKNLGSNLSLKDQKLLIQAILPFTSIKRSVEKTKLIIDTLELAETSMDKPKEALLSGLSSVWSSTIDAIRTFVVEQKMGLLWKLERAFSINHIQFRGSPQYVSMHPIGCKK